MSPPGVSMLKTTAVTRCCSASSSTRPTYRSVIGLIAPSMRATRTRGPRHASALDIPVRDPLLSVLRAPKIDELLECRWLVGDRLAMRRGHQTVDADAAARVALEVAEPVRGAVGAQPDRAVGVREPHPHGVRLAAPASGGDELELLRAPQRSLEIRVAHVRAMSARRS